MGEPRKYAAAGVVHSWRVEQGADGLPVVVRLRTRPGSKAYTATGIYRHTLKLDVPFPLAVDLTAVDERRPRRP